jgi:hypothetical protein
VARWSFENVRVALALPSKEMISQVGQSLRANGLRRCFAVFGIEALRAHLAGGDVDLLITVPELEGSDVARVVQDLRHGKVGDDLFTIIITLLENASPASVQWVVESGTDDLLLFSTFADQLGERLDNFVLGRKPFVVTHDYVGPDRRPSHPKFSASAPRLEVPNPVRWQVVANSESTSYKQLVRDARDRINVHKIKSYGGQLVFLADRIIKAYAAEPGRKAIAPDVGNLDSVAHDLVARMSGTKYTEADELVKSLQALCARLNRQDRDIKPAEVEILPVLTRVIGSVFDQDPEAVSWEKTAHVF